MAIVWQHFDPLGVRERPDPLLVPALHDAHVVREPPLQPLLEADHQVNVAAELHQAVVAQQVALGANGAACVIDLSLKLSSETVIFFSNYRETEKVIMIG